jgi:hypothetical protein
MSHCYAEIALAEHIVDVEGHIGIVLCAFAIIADIKLIGGVNRTGGFGGEASHSPL